MRLSRLLRLCGGYRGCCGYRSCCLAAAALAMRSGSQRLSIALPVEVRCLCLFDGCLWQFSLRLCLSKGFGLHIGSSEYIHWENLSFKDSGHVRSLKCNVTIFSATVAFMFEILGSLKLQFSGRTCAGHRASCAFSTGACRLRMHVSIIVDWRRENFQTILIVR